ncbi:hypothetical protein KEM48_011047 [Puccinia striiformis f. sp. tritici PST-130]|nr:hypothetical protein KEM48_011047 [Puccinia striiformis f. sp. tritici PST-130]
MVNKNHYQPKKYQKIRTDYTQATSNRLSSSNSIYAKTNSYSIGLTQSQLSGWLKEEDELRNYLLDIKRTGDFPQIEDALLRSYLEFKSKNNGIDPKDEHHTKQFKARNNPKSYKLPRLPTTLTCLENESRLDTTRTTIQSFTEAYHHRDIYSMGDIKLFCNLAIFRGSINVNPEERNRIRYVICTNGNGSDKRDPLIIRSHQDPETFLTGDSKSYCIVTLLVPRILRLSFQNGSKDSIEICIDKNVKLFNRQYYYHTSAPPYHSIYQSTSSGINQSFKSNYRRNLLEFDTTTQTDTTPPKTTHEQLIAIQSANSAREEISPTTISNCFLHLQIFSNQHPLLPLHHNPQFV